MMARWVEQIKAARQNNGTLAPLEKAAAIISNKYESTTVLSATGTEAYCAPEAGSDAWRQHASAVDAWSFGIMLLELGAGCLYSWATPIGKIAFQPGRLDAAVPPYCQSTTTGCRALWDVAMQLFDTKPHNRPIIGVALLSEFFSTLWKSP
ncbi:hypothetical protein WJX77_005864 [Trebouxia sp. C0004]